MLRSLDMQIDKIEEEEVRKAFSLGFKFTLEGRIKGKEGGKPIETPFKVEMSAEDILYAHINAGNYDRATGLIESIFEDSLKAMRKGRKAKDTFSDRVDYQTYVEKPNYIRAMHIAQQGTIAFMAMYNETDDEKYINKVVGLWDRLARTKETRYANIAEAMVNFATTGESETNPLTGKLVKVYHPKIKRAIVRAFIRIDKYQSALEFAEELGDYQLKKYIDRYQKMKRPAA